MILSVRINNFLVYANKTELSLIADMRIKKFYSNVYQENNFNVVKSACIYGGNNVGKSCTVRAINSIRNVLLSIGAEVPPNLFRQDKLCSLGISFLYEGKAYSYDFSFDSTLINHYAKGFVYERLTEITIDRNGNKSEKELFIRDMINDNYKFADDPELSILLKAVSPNNIIIYTINSEKYPIIGYYKNILRTFASKIEILDANDIPIGKTIQVLKENKKQCTKIVDLIKLADLDIDDYKYLKMNNNIKLPPNIPLAVPKEVILKATVAAEDVLCLTSIHKGKAMQSLIIDSTGTKKMVSLASYIVQALDEGKILVVDELDSSLHFKLTRAIVSLFNNELNTKAQLIFTAHDGTLLDCKKLFRKDQIWFADKEETGAYLKPLSDFTSKENNVRSSDDLLEKYKFGVFGALPEPDLIDILLGDDDNE
ncbi:MAG: ATP-binding protein [Clostridia bacterium]|nr:ATP-binding protein [Clostridia bacterium]